MPPPMAYFSINPFFLHLINDGQCSFHKLYFLLKKSTYFEFGNGKNKNHPVIPLLRKGDIFADLAYPKLFQ